MTATAFTVNFDNEASGPFVALTDDYMTWAGGGIGHIVVLVQQTSTTGKLECILIAGAIPTDGQVLTQTGTTADTNGNAELMLYPPHFRVDTTLPASGFMTWAGPFLGATHSFFWDGQTSNFVVGEILTFTAGQRCEVVTIVADAGADGEVDVRWISNINEPFPADDDTFTGDIAGDGTLNGLVYDRAYRALHIHRLLGNLNDDPISSGDDVWSMIDEDAAVKDTDEIVRLLSTITITDEITRHMYAGSVSHTNGDTLYSGVNIGVTSPNADTEPVLIQYDPTTGLEAVVTGYWKNAYMADSIKGKVRILRKTRENGVDIAQKQIRGALLEFNEIYFFAATTLDVGSTGLGLFSSADGNNTTAQATVAGAPYNTIVITEGYQLLDYSNGNGSTPFGGQLGLGSASKIQGYERTKWIQTRTESETLFGRLATLNIGFNRNFTYDNEIGGAPIQNTHIAWGAEIAFSNEAVANFAQGEAVSFVGSGALGRVLLLDDDGTTGVLICYIESGTPLASDTLLGLTSGATADVDTVADETLGSGTGWAPAIVDNGTTGDFWYQAISGIDPVDGQKVHYLNGATIGEVQVDEPVDGVNLRTINFQFIGLFTGDFQTTFGWGLDPSDAEVNDKLRNLLDVVQQPPNNQTGSVAGGVVGDYMTCFPWDGSTNDTNGDPLPTFAETTLNTALTGASTQVDIGSGNIRDNTAQVGGLRVERDSDNELDLILYDSHDGDAIFEIIGTAPSVASIGNTVMRAPIDKVVQFDPETWTAVVGASEQFTITLRRGGAGTIKPARTQPTFGATGFAAILNRVSDL